VYLCLLQQTFVMACPNRFSEAVWQCLFHLWSFLLSKGFFFLMLVFVGYVLDGLPTVSEEHMKIEQQIELIKSWNLQPDFVINIKVILDSVIYFVTGDF